MFSERLYNFDNFFQKDFWPDFFFVNTYSLPVVLWNLLLLFIPFWLCRGLIRYWQSTQLKKTRQKAAAFIIGFIWLLFIPNAAYIITDVRHLAGYCAVNSPAHVCPESVWMIIFFFTYAVIGWIALVVLLNQMRDFIKQAAGRRPALVFIIGVIPLVAAGVLLGLINRWNSWEIFLYPAAIVKSALIYVTDPVYFMNWLAFTAGFYVLYFLGNRLFKRLQITNHYQ